MITDDAAVETVVRKFRERGYQFDPISTTDSMASDSLNYLYTRRSREWCRVSVWMDDDREVFGWVRKL